MRKALDYSCPNPSSSHLHRRLCHQVQGLATETPKRPTGADPFDPPFSQAHRLHLVRPNASLCGRDLVFQIFQTVRSLAWKLSEMCPCFLHRFFQFSCKLSQVAVPRPMVDAHIAASRQMLSLYISIIFKGILAGRHCGWLRVKVRDADDLKHLDRNTLILEVSE